MEHIKCETGKIKLPRLFSNGMVLQRGEPVRIWGWSSPHQTVRIRFRGTETTAEATESGEWSARLPAQPAGGPCSMEISAEETVTLQDLWVGEVWLCFGQSNMVLPMVRVRDLYEEDIALSYNAGIRFFTVPDRSEFKEPQADFAGGQWEWANPESVLHFGATAYFFARTLFERYKVPIGIINASVGGSPIEAWMSREALQAFPALLDKAKPFQNDDFVRRLEEANRAAESEWHTRLNRADKGLNARPQWSEEDCDDSGWKTMTIPGRWENLLGAVWFRREFDVPAHLAGKSAFLRMGRIIDSDTVYVNGIFAGSTGYQYPPRKYAVPGGVLKAGRNTISVRVVNWLGSGGFAEGKPYEIRFASGEVLSLSGEWRTCVGASAEELPEPIRTSRQPTALFNGMLAPAASYTFKGCAWYQGESNTGNPENYQALLEAMIADLREKSQKPLPFLIVQLPNYADENPACKDGWPAIREQQRGALRLPHTGLAVTIDAGEWNDLHPLAKKPIGTRLALLAAKIAYGEDVICAAPMPQSAARGGNTLTVSFDGEIFAASPAHLELADESGVFHPATAKILGETLLIQSEAVPAPTAVRYAWADNPVGANLCGTTGLPVSPFCLTI